MRLHGPPGDVERHLGWVVTLGGFSLVPLYLLGIPPGGSQPSGWQQAGSAALAALLVLIAVGRRVFPIWLLTVLYTAFPVIVGLLGLGTFAPTGAPIPDDLRPWPYGVEALAYAYLAVRVSRTSEMILYPLLITLSPLASAFLFAVPVHEMPEHFLADLPTFLVHLGFGVFVFVIRVRMRVFETSRGDLRRAEERRVRAAAEEERRQAFSLLVHDNVLSVLCMAMLRPGLESDELRVEARAALELLERPESQSHTVATDEAPSTADLRAEWEAAWRRIDPQCRIVVHDLGGYVPARVALALEAAAAEALRNSVRHAGAGASREIVVQLAGDRVEVSVADDGAGFEAGMIGSERLGVRAGIVDRIERIGGTVTVSTEPGPGTFMRITWLRHG
ncbi:MAG TPA: hypothetical protein PKE40_06425 [Arachnia sp.]|nr:hypothetical protein [Arachnia sp.]HMT85972.1 hypothetical protein [Arachnia sp.]